MMFMRGNTNWKDVEDQVMKIIAELNSRYTYLVDKTTQLEEKIAELEKEPTVINHYHYNQPQPIFNPPNPYPYTTWCAAPFTGESR